MKKKKKKSLSISKRGVLILMSNNSFDAYNSLKVDCIVRFIFNLYCITVSCCCFL